MKITNEHIEIFTKAVKIAAGMVAPKFPGFGLMYKEDFKQEAMIGLIKFYERKEELKMHLQGCVKIARWLMVAYAKKLMLTAKRGGGIFHVEFDDVFENILYKKENEYDDVNDILTTALKKAINILTAKEQFIIGCIFFRGQSGEEVGKFLGVTRAGVSAILVKEIFPKLKKEIKALVPNFDKEINTLIEHRYGY